jgi:hypothetical protein
MESNASSFLTLQRLAALMLQVAVLRSCVAIVHGMEACTEHLLVHFKQHAVIEFLTFKGVSPAEIHW